MVPGAFLILLVLAVGAIVAIRVGAGHFDRDRIRAYVEARGGTVHAIEWQPFGRGWYGERGDRIYLVRFVDAHGAQREAQCKTRAFSGVYWTEGSPDVARGSAAKDEVERLREENRRLRDQLGR